MSPARARTRTARSGEERTNHEAIAPPFHERMVTYNSRVFISIYGIQILLKFTQSMLYFSLFLRTAGLNLELNIEQEDYIGVLAPEAGIRMDISTQGEMPFPLERGVSLAPGYATMIGLRKVKKTVKHSTMMVQFIQRQ